MKYYYSVLLVSILIISCNKETDISDCGVEDPLEELEWLRNVKASYYFGSCDCQPSIYQAKYRGMTVFYFSINSFLCDGTGEFSLFNCEGEVIKEISRDHDFNKDPILEAKLLYTCGE